MDRNDTLPKSEPKLDPAIEDLLSNLADLPPRSFEPPVEDEEIERYRRGELSGEERRRLEHRLAADERGMERLARIVTRPAARRPQTWRLAASVFVGALGASMLFYALRTGEAVPVETPAYTVTLQGLAERRGPQDAASPTVRAGSTVRIVARPAAATAADLEFTLYGPGPAGALTRVTQAAAGLSVTRGTVVLELEASRVVGAEPGVHELVLLIGPASFSPPPSIAPEQLEELAREHGLQVHPLELRLLPADAGAPA